MADYATPADVKPLLGNVAEGISDAQLTLAIASATDEINSKTNRQPPNDWQTTDVNFDLVKKLARYMAASEASIGIHDYAEDREFMRKEINRMFDTLTTTDTGEDTDFVESSEHETWPLKETGIIYSTRFKNLKKDPDGENDFNIFG